MEEKEQLIKNISNARPVMERMVEIMDMQDVLSAKIGKKEDSKIAVILAYLFLGSLPLLQLGNVKSFAGFIVLLIFALPIILFILHRKKKKARMSQYFKNAQEIEALKLNVALVWLPESYRHPYCYYNIAEYISNGRADNLKEALNLLETQMHQERLEAAALANLRYMR